MPSTPGIESEDTLPATIECGPRRSQRKRRPPRNQLQNRNLKKPLIDLSRNIIHMTYTTFIFLKVF